MVAWWDVVVPDAATDALVSFCDATGLAWGPNQRDLFFYRPPALHVAEFVIFHAFVCVVFMMVPGYFRSVVPSASVQSMPKSWLNRAFGWIFLGCWLFQVVLKAMRPRPLVQLCWMFMPCHLITLAWVYVFLYSGPRQRNYRFCVYLVSMVSAFHWGPTSAAMFPDWSDHQFKIEGSIFILHHGMLVLMPIYFAARYGLLPFTRNFLLHATWVATLINVGPYTLISYVSGLNVNYHLYPPPKLMSLAVFATPYYRFYVVGLLVLMTIGFYCGIVVLGRLCKIILGPLLRRL
ncbi:transmembrane protein, putative [Bodo saltans]|uniref:Transmembrane protein, putative n=1 Tax=Bodo saltans TaxID=75058 RepID=A0A0S4JGE0_BODSA|nr:transmembrane protein, putative [Bodo saltans]|eukprot:CUG90599.1 transmembrane protein, putative [Bodo saltans]